MTRFKTSARLPWAIVLAATALALLPAAAAAQLGDPSPGTPQANQYEIPVQAGRHDRRSAQGPGQLWRWLAVPLEQQLRFLLGRSR